MDKKLSELGGHTFYKRGEADDAKGLDKVVKPWVKELPQALIDELNRLKSLSAEKKRELLVV